MDVEDNVDQLVKKAMENGGIDNTTTMVFEISKEKERTNNLKSSSIVNKIKNFLIKKRGN